MSESIYAIDNFVTVQPGEPFRLFPIGQLVKDGVKRLLTPELLAKFRLPHFKPPIKLGSHAEETRSGGRILSLEVREDGLWAHVELTEEGRAAFERGDYAYHSPEVVWDGWLENPETGDKIEGPIIMGDALLHTPHLGEAAALYSIEVIDGGETDMTTNQDMVSVSAVEKFMNMFKGEQPQAPAEPQEPQTPAESVESFEAEYQAAKAERDDLAAKVAAMEAETARGERIAAYTVELGEKVTPDVYGILADLPEETADLLLKALKALGEQAEAAGLTEDVGNAGATDTAGDPAEALHAAIQQVQTEKGVGYNEAFSIVQIEQPDLFGFYVGGN